MASTSDTHGQCVKVTQLAACRVVYILWKRSAALKGLPGPKYNSMLGQLYMLSVNDPHRYTSLWADQYGPLVRLRILFFHVSLLLCLFCHR